MEYVAIYILGMCTMFYGIMTWMFWRKGDRLSRLVALLMGTVCIGCVKDVVFACNDVHISDFYWAVMTSVDMVAVPMYAFILMELVRPGMVTRRLALIHEMPFVLLPVLFVATGHELFYYILVGWAGVYGTFYLCWTSFNIPRYDAMLRERFSYTDNINLNWLRVILYSFYLVLGVWILDCLVFRLGVECLYMCVAMGIWMVIDYFIYKHESVLDELEECGAVADGDGADEAAAPPSLNRRVEALLIDQQAFLNPHLKVSDVAAAVGTNRTYVSNYFNREAGSSFYDYVNGLRVEYACRLLESTDESVKCIAEQSGFNSPQSFIRVFTRIKGVTPTTYVGGVND